MRDLEGIRIAVTRAASQAEELAAPLRERGASVVPCPLIRFESCEVPDLPIADWIVLTSVNGVDYFMARKPEIGSARFACVGPATAQRLQDYGYDCHVVPDVYTGEAVAIAIAAVDDLQNKKVLLARAAGGGEALPHHLRSCGAEVHDVALYRSVPDAEGANALNDAILQRKIDVITFTSGSTIRYFVETVGSSAEFVIAVIGPSTAEVARDHGLRVDIEADPHTTAGLVQALVKYYGGLNAGK